jgi:hypothetical protein
MFKRLVRGLFALGLVFCPAPDALALGKGKVKLIAGSSEGTSPSMAAWARNDGRIKTSELAFVFVVGSRSIMIPYANIVSLQYGHVPREEIMRVAMRGRSIRIPHEFSPVVNDLLTITYREQDDEHIMLLWLGREMVRPTLADLERRTGHQTQFDRIGACVQYKTPDECGDGHPRTLRALKRVFIEVEVGPNADNLSRDRIMSEIAKAALGLQLLDSIEDAQVVLRFRADYAPTWPGDVGPVLGTKLGNGWVSVIQSGRLRELFAFADEKQSVVARMPATNFARAFVREYREANK